MNRYLAISVFVTSLFTIVPPAHAGDSYSIELIEERADRHYVYKSFHVRVLDIDLIIQLNSGLNKGNEGYVPSIEAPAHLHVRSRTDLVPIIGEMLRRGEEPLVERFTAWYLLPHIDSPEAAALLVEHPSYKGDGIHELTVRWAKDLPLPEDVADPPMWIRHAGNDLVLDKIEKDLDDLTDRPSTPSPFWLLATSDSSRAITLLDAFLGKFPEWKAAKLGDLLHNEHLVSKTAWKYITDAIGQYCDSVTVDWNGIYAMEFFDFRPGDDPEKYIREFSWSVLDSLANIYLDNLLHHEDFTRIMLVGEYRGNLPDTLSTQGMLYGIYPYVDLLRFCERYGIRKQIEPLQDALEKFERALFDRRLRWPLLNIFFREKLNWPLGRGGALSGPDYKTAVKVYKEQKAAALKAMASRE